MLPNQHTVPDHPDLPAFGALRAAFGAALLVVAALLGACASGSGGLTDDGSPAADRRLYEARCGMCHVPFQKSNFAAHQWPAIVANFAPRAGLTPPQRERILRYLTSPEPPR